MLRPGRENLGSASGLASAARGSAFGITPSSVASSARSAQFMFGRRGCRRCNRTSWWRRIKISAVFHASLLWDSRSHEATRVTRRKTNRRHLIRIIAAGRLGEQLCWSEPWTRFSARTGSHDRQVLALLGREQSARWRRSCRPPCIAADLGRRDGLKVVAVDPELEELAARDRVDVRRIRVRVTLVDGGAEFGRKRSRGEALERSVRRLARRDLPSLSLHLSVHALDALVHDVQRALRRAGSLSVGRLHMQAARPARVLALVSDVAHPGIRPEELRCRQHTGLERL